MRIGIDIDGVMTDMEEMILEYGTKFCYENEIDYKINLKEYYEKEILNISDDNVIKFWNTYFGKYVKECKSRQFASEVIKELKKDNKIYIITARNEEGLSKEVYGKMQELTINWLATNKIEYDKIFFDAQDKSKICTENNIDIMIDDAPKNINEVCKKIPVLCFNEFYNQDIEGKNVIRVYGWYDILKKIKNIRLSRNNDYREKSAVSAMENL